MFSLLYVDDEADLLELGKLFLEKGGEFSVVTENSAREGLQKLAEIRFNAVISDYQMPGMDGIELLKQVRSLYGSLPFLLFTGRGREEVVIEAINNGADFYVQKGGDPLAQFAELGTRSRSPSNGGRLSMHSGSRTRRTGVSWTMPTMPFSLPMQRRECLSMQTRKPRP